MTILGFTSLVKREASTAWKGGGGYAARAGFVSLLVVVAIAVWSIMVFRYGMTPKDYGDFARNAFSGFSYIQFFLVTVVGTIGFSRSLVREKEQKTLDLLILSPLSNFEILFGKFLGETLGNLSIIVAAIPVFCSFLILGGFTITELLSIHLILAGHLMVVGSICALVGVLMSNSFRVMLTTWGIIAIIMLGPTIGSFLAPNFGIPWSILEPYSSLGVLNGELATTVGVNLGASFLVFGIGGVLLGISCAIGGSLLEIRSRRTRENTGLGIFKLMKSLLNWGLENRWIRWILRPRLRVTHPLIRRECFLPDDRKFCACFLLSVLIYLAILAFIQVDPSMLRMIQRHALVAFFGLGSGIFLSLIWASHSMYSDKADGTLEILLAMDVTPENILHAKWLGGVYRTFYLIIFPIIHLLLLVIITVWDGQIAKHRLSEFLLRLPLIGFAVFIGLSYGIFQTLSIALKIRRSFFALTFGPLTALLIFGLTALLMGLNFYITCFLLPFLLLAFMVEYLKVIKRLRKNALNR